MNNHENILNTVLGGRYRLTTVIGIGGMAVVYEADDLQIGRKVAVKMLKDDIKEDELELKRFINESKAIAMMSHPNIVQIFDVSVKSEGEHQYIVMELINGITLKDYISKAGSLKWQEAIGYVRQILQALAHAHEKGIIHRDVKPHNVMLLRNGNLKITDFGIAKIPSSEQLTMTDKAIGTVHYISPEQVNGNGNTSTVSDIYSVGIILYEIMTGKLPFDGENAFLIARKQMDEEPRNPREINPAIPAGLSQIILKAMNKNPRDRYQTADEMIKQLDIIKGNPAVIFNMKPVSNSAAVVPTVIGNTPQQQQQNQVVRSRDNNRSITQQRRQRPRSDMHHDENEMRKRGRTEKKAKRRQSSRTWLPVISGIFLAFVIVLVLSLVNIFHSIMSGPNAADNTVTIGNFAGRNINDVIAEVEGLARVMVGDITFDNNDTVAENYIISHTPPPYDVRRWQGNDIRINFRVSKGRYAYIVQDLSVIEARSVALDLEARGIRVTTVDQSHDFVPMGHIISTYPEPGAIVRAGETLRLYVSVGQRHRTVLMPNVVGKTEREARMILSEEEIIIAAIISEHSDAPIGEIIEQSIIPFRQVPARTTRVTLRISIGPEPPEEDD